MKKCPYCGADLQDAAIVCSFCGHELVSARRAAAARLTMLQVTMVVAVVIVVALLVWLVIGS